MDFTDEQKDKLEGDLLEIIATGLDNETITDQDTPQISRYVLERIDTLKTQDDVRVFLTDMATKWPIFSALAIVTQEKEEDKKEDQAVDNAAELVRQGKYDEALQVAKEATE